MQQHPEVHIRQGILISIGDQLLFMYIRAVTGCEALGNISQVYSLEGMLPATQ